MADSEWAERLRATRDHREFVGPAGEYDLSAAMQFNLLTFFGLRESHALLDIGCGSLRAGRVLMVYLRPGHYFGIEPEEWLVEKAVSEEIGRDLIALKSPTFIYARDYPCSRFGRTFDFIQAQGVFTHAPESHIRQCVAEAAKCMTPDSLFAATFFEGPTDHAGQDWLYPGTTSYRPARMQEIASGAGLECTLLDWPHPRGARWMILHHARLGPEIAGKAERIRRCHGPRHDRRLSRVRGWVARALRRIRPTRGGAQ